MTEPAKKLTALPDPIVAKLADNAKRAREMTNAADAVMRGRPATDEGDAEELVQPGADDDDPESAAPAEGDAGGDDSDADGEPTEGESDPGKPAKLHPAKKLAKAKQLAEKGAFKALEKLLGLEPGTLKVDDNLLRQNRIQRVKLKKERDSLTLALRNAQAKHGPILQAQDDYEKGNYAAAARALPLIFAGTDASGKRVGHDLATITKNLAKAHMPGGATDAKEAALSRREEELTRREREQTEEARVQKSKQAAVRRIQTTIAGHGVLKYYSSPAKAAEAVMAELEEHWDAERKVFRKTPAQVADIMLKRVAPPVRRVARAPQLEDAGDAPPPVATNGKLSQADLDRRMELNRARARALTDTNLRRLGRQS